MLTQSDIEAMAADLAEIRGDNEINLLLRRGDWTLPYQPARIAKLGGTANEKSGEASQETRGRVIVLGPLGMDIQTGDRFNDAAGVLYQVTFVRPNRRAAVEAEAEMVE
jgi:hypothetical protein